MKTKKLVVQKNPFGADIEIGVDVDVQNFTMKQRREGGDLIKIKIRRIKNVKTGEGQILESR